MIEGAAALPPESAPRRLTTVVAADICGYSRLAEIDDDAAIRTVTLVRAAFEQVVARRRGRLFHAAGDGFLAEFPSAADGVLAALEFVADIKARDKLSPISPGAKVRAGVHAGDVVEQPGGDLLGHGVNIAARLQGEAEPNGVLVSLAAVNLVRDSISARFTRRGALWLRNIEDPVVAFDASAGRPNNLASKMIARMRRVRPLYAAALIATSFSVYAVGQSRGKAVEATAAPPPFSFGATDARPKNAPTATNSPETGQSYADLYEALRTLSAPARAPSDSIWLRGVLTELRRSGGTVGQEVFDLLAKKDLGAAVEKLKRDYEARKLSLDDAEKVSRLLTLGALTFDQAPGESVAFHRAILDIAPEHFLAHVRLGELYYGQSEYVRADRAFTRALEIGSPFRDQEVYAIIKYAASLTIEEKYGEASQLLTNSLREAQTRGWDSLVVIAQNRVAYLELKRRNFDAARAALNATTAFLQGGDYPDELVFAYSALGRIELEEGDFKAAEPLFEKALELALQVGRPVGLADTYFYVGLTQIELGDPKKAEATFQTALDVARGAREFGYNNLKNMEVKNHIGKALAYKLQGLTDRACKEMSIADEVDARRDIIYNPATVELVRRVGCPFGPLLVSVAAN